MGECEETREVHFVVVKGEVGSRDSDEGPQISIDVQTLLEEFDNVIPDDLPIGLPPVHNIQHHPCKT